MNKTKTEDLVDFGSKGKERTKDFHYVVFYRDSALIGTNIIQAKSRVDLKKAIHKYIETEWSADKDKISYKIR